MTDEAPHSSTLRLALLGRCPACEQGRLFRNPLEFRETCDSCGLDIRQHDNGDGPAFFVIIIVGFLVTGLAAWVEFTYEPPFWLHAVLWMPFILISSFLLLRIFKATLLILQYRHRASENDHE